MKSAKITAVVTTKNEEHRLPLIFQNLKDFSELVVFDGGSTDRTEEVCHAHGVKFIVRPPEGRFVVGADVKFAWSHIETPYVLSVNCSHYYPELLLNEFSKVAEEGLYKAVYHDVVIYSYGQIVHRPFFRRRSSACNFYRVDAINFENSIVHNETPVEVSKSERLVLPAEDKYSIHLFRDYDVKKAEGNHGFYGDLDSAHRFTAGMRTNFRLILWRPIKYFLHQYIRCGSVRYGVAGFIYAVLFAQLELNIQMKIWELQNGLNMKNITEKNIEMRRFLFNKSCQ